jgi:serine phosphatase RsbU (regulator of sigma subunit)/CHASE3 domain sensor protein
MPLRSLMRPFISTIATLGLLLVLFVLALSAWVSDENTKQLVENERWVKHTYDVLEDLDNLLVTVLDAETGQRGYLLTGKRRFLKPYQQAIDRVGRQLAELARDTADNLQQQQSLPVLRAAIVDHLQSLEETLALHSSTVDSELDVQRLEREKQSMDRVRGLVSAMRQQEVSLLGERMQRSHNSFRNTRLVFAATTAVSMGLVLLTHVLLRRDITGRQRANARLKLVNEELRESLRAAAKVQESFLPRPRIEIPGLKFAWAFRPCEELAGDALNVCPLDGDQVAVYLLDVSGHGAAAALLAVSVIQALAPAAENHRLALGPECPIEPDEVARELDRRFPVDDATGRFFTILYGIVDARRQEFRFVSAGHPAPAHVTHQQSAALLEGYAGLPIGLSGEYRQSAMQLAAGDRLYLYSDGVTETMNVSGELFGTQRLLSALERGRDMELQESIDLVLSELRQWHGTMRPRDDISILAIEAD